MADSMVDQRSQRADGQQQRYSRGNQNSRGQQSDSDDSNDDNGDYPMVLLSMKCHYLYLLWLIRQLRPDISENTRQNETRRAPRRLTATENGQTTLPRELCAHIASYFVVQPVIPTEVEAVMASSTDGRNSLKCTLDVDDDSTWWISGSGSMPSGKGRQWVQYRLGPSTQPPRPSNSQGGVNAHEPIPHTSPTLPLGTIRRLTNVYIKIPPLPMGPLSVRDFHLETLIRSEGIFPVAPVIWKQVSPKWTVLNRTGLQQFVLPQPIDATDIRIVCRSNQLSSTTDALDDPERVGLPVHHMSMVGYYSVKFE